MILFDLEPGGGCDVPWEFDWRGPLNLDILAGDADSDRSTSRRAISSTRPHKSTPALPDSSKPQSTLRL